MLYDLISALSILLPAIYMLVNGIYALVNPDKYIRARWTVTRGLIASDGSRRSGSLGIRLVGGICILGGLLWICLVVVGIGGG